jgi:hypothetical protein
MTEAHSARRSRAGRKPSLERVAIPSPAPVELAEAEVAVGDKGAHGDFNSILRTTRPVSVGQGLENFFVGPATRQSYPLRSVSSRIR